jgi:hypothetical protein
MKSLINIIGFSFTIAGVFNLASEIDGIFGIIFLLSSFYFLGCVMSNG